MPFTSLLPPCDRRQWISLGRLCRSPSPCGGFDARFLGADEKGPALGRASIGCTVARTSTRAAVVIAAAGIAVVRAVRIVRVVATVTAISVAVVAVIAVVAVVVAR